LAGLGGAGSLSPAKAEGMGLRVTAMRAIRLISRAKRALTFLAMQ
jgi:hypothetical protein